MTKREHIKSLIEAGGATIESLCAATETSPKALNSQIATLRLMGFCPVKDGDGVFTVTDREGWESILLARKEGSAAKRATKTPAEAHDLSVTRLTRARKALQYADKLLLSGETELHTLKRDRAFTDTKIAEILYNDSLVDCEEAELEMVEGDEGLMEVVYEESEVEDVELA